MDEFDHMFIATCDLNRCTLTLGKTLDTFQSSLFILKIKTYLAKVT